MINQIGPTKSVDRLYQPSDTKMATDKKPKNTIDDSVSIKEETIQYASYTKTGELSIEPDSQYYQLRSIVSALLSEQGMTLSDAIGGKSYEIDEATQAKAKELIAEDGFWGVEQTSDRIFEFAVNNAGNDKSKFEDIKAAVEKGFEIALDSFGGTLPEISYKTYDALMKKLDAWANDTEENTETKAETS